MPTSLNLAGPNLPSAPVEYDQRYQDQFGNVLRLFHNAVVNAVNAPCPYGSYYDTTIQTNPVANVVRPMRLNSIAVQKGVERGSTTSRVYVSQTAVYNIQFSAQLDKSGGSSDYLYIWLRINGIDIQNSASKVVINGPNDERIVSWNFVMEMQANSYFELVWSSPDTGIFLSALPAATPVPEIPSVIVTVTWVSGVSVR
jgi:hypothetical protein